MTDDQQAAQLRAMFQLREHDPNDLSPAGGGWAGLPVDATPEQTARAFWGLPQPSGEAAPPAPQADAASLAIASSGGTHHPDDSAQDAEVGQAFDFFGLPQPINPEPYHR